MPLSTPVGNPDRPDRPWYYPPAAQAAVREALALLEKKAQGSGKPPAAAARKTL